MVHTRTGSSRFPTLFPLSALCNPSRSEWAKEKGKGEVSVLGKPTGNEGKRKEEVVVIMGRPAGELGCRRTQAFPHLHV